MSNLGTKGLSMKELDIQEDDRLWYIGYVREQHLHAQELLNNKQWEELTRVFHNIAGSGTSFQFPQFTELGKKGELACDSKDPKAANRILTSIGDLIKSLEEKPSTL